MTFGFNPRPPGGGRHGTGWSCGRVVSIHAPPEEGDYAGTLDVWLVTVSIHAPPEEGDVSRACQRGSHARFNPRPPGGGRRRTVVTVGLQRFNPRPPGGGRRERAGLHVAMSCFNPRPPGGGRLQCRHANCESQSVSIHAPPEEGDPAPRQLLGENAIVSIHAPPEEGDTSWPTS